MKKVLLLVLLVLGVGEALGVVYVKPGLKNCVKKCQAANPPCTFMVCPDVVVNCPASCQINPNAF